MLMYHLAQNIPFVGSRIPTLYVPVSNMRRSVVVKPSNHIQNQYLIILQGFYTARPIAKLYPVNYAVCMDKIIIYISPHYKYE